MNQKPNDRLINISCQWKHSGSETFGLAALKQLAHADKKEDAFGGEDKSWHYFSTIMSERSGLVGL